MGEVGSQDRRNDLNHLIELKMILARDRSGEKTIAGLPSREPPHGPYYRTPYDLLVLFPLQRARGVHQPPTWRQSLKSPAENLALKQPQIFDVLGTQPPLDFRIARQRARAAAGRIDQNTIETAPERQGL